jgi:hypothetical protein
MLVFVGLFWGGIAVLAAFNKHSINKVIEFVVLYSCFLFWYFRFGSKVNVRRLKQIYGDGKNAGVIGEHDLEILQDGIREMTVVNEQLTKYPGIERVEVTQTHVYIYIGPIYAYIIPKAKVTEGDLDAFITELKDKMQSSGNCQPILNKSTMER